jgi:hypothetical protein
VRFLVDDDFVRRVMGLLLLFVTHSSHSLPGGFKADRRNANPPIR